MILTPLDGVHGHFVKGIGRLIHASAVHCSCPNAINEATAKLTARAKEIPNANAVIGVDHCITSAFEPAQPGRTPHGAERYVAVLTGLAVHIVEDSEDVEDDGDPGLEQ